jgi:hypothetical protein
VALLSSLTYRIRQVVRNKTKRRLYWFHLKSIGLERPRKTRIVFCCNGKAPHGGLIDRLKGIVSMYEVALRIDADFYIQFTDPFDLSTYLAPNKIKWEHQRIRFNPITDRILYKVTSKTKPNNNPISWFNLLKPRTYFVYCNTDYLPALYPELTSAEIKIVWRDRYMGLFQNAPALNNGLSCLPTEKRFACHIRFAGILGDFHDVFSKRLSVSETLALFALLDDRLRKLAQQHSEWPLYVLSDSPIFLEHIKTQGLYGTLPGTPKHIDVNNETTGVEDHLKTFTDLLFMANSELIYAFVMPPLYYSNFGLFASIIGNKMYRVVKQ